MKKHILLIDEDKNELTIFMDALRKVPHDDGFKCTYAGSAAQAMEMLKYLVPDYIFTDFNGHDANSTDLLSFIKGQERLEKTKLCIYSSDINGNTHKAAAMGAHYIQKTDAIDVLASGLSRFFGHSPVPDYSYL